MGIHVYRKQRAWHIVIRGQVKKEINCADLWQGQEYEKKFTNVPYLVGGVVRLVKPLLPPSFNFDINAESPYFLSRVMASRAMDVSTVLFSSLTLPMEMKLLECSCCI